MTAIDRLLAIIETVDGPLTRKRLEEERRKLKPITVNSFAAKFRAPVNTPASIELTAPPETATKVSALLVGRPSSADMSLLDKNFVPGGEPPCLGFSEIVTNDVIVAIVASFGDVINLIDKLPCWGVNRLLRLYIPTPPSGPDVMSAEAIAIFGRAKSNLVDRLDGWPVETDPVKLAQSLLSEVPGRRVHLFARAETAGWEARIGDANWSAKPAAQG